MLNIDVCCEKDLLNPTCLESFLIDSLEVLDNKLEPMVSKLKKNSLFGNSESEICEIETLFDVVMFYKYLDILYGQRKDSELGVEFGYTTSVETIPEKIYKQCPDYYQKYYDKIGLDMSEFIALFKKPSI